MVRFMRGGIPVVVRGGPTGVMVPPILCMVDFPPIEHMKNGVQRSPAKPSRLCSWLRSDRCSGQQYGVGHRGR